MRCIFITNCQKTWVNKKGFFLQNRMEAEPILIKSADFQFLSILIQGESRET